jgi:hypothetical protein
VARSRAGVGAAMGNRGGRNKNRIEQLIPVCPSPAVPSLFCPALPSELSQMVSTQPNSAWLLGLLYTGHDIIPSLRISLSPGWCYWIPLFGLIKIFPCCHLSRQRTPLDKHLDHYGITLLHEATIQNEIRLKIGNVQLRN